MRDLLRAVGRCLTFRRFDPYDLPSSGWLVTGGVFASLIGGALCQWSLRMADWSFNAYGLNFYIAASALLLGLLLIVLGAHRILAKATVVLWADSATKLGFGILGLVATLVWPEYLTKAHPYLLILVLLPFAVLALAWGVMIPVIVMRSFDPFHWRRPILGTLAFLVVPFSLPYILPFDPLFYSQSLAAVTPDPVWLPIVEVLSSDDGDAAATEESQADTEAWYRQEWDQTRAIDETLAALPPTDPDKPTVYAITLGGMSQGVFDRESQRAGAIIGSAFGIGARSVRLINGEGTPNEPAATVESLARTIAAVGKRMNGERDALILFLTSHGGEDGVALSGPHAHQSVIRPLDLRFALDAAGIRNRILIVSACHSGVFVPIFSDEHSAVFTAAAADRTSFGCNDTNEWTYFGDAFFAHGLTEQHTLVGAFVAARKLIWSWEEKLDHHSLPQVHVGTAIAADFPRIIGDPAALDGSDPADMAPAVPSKTAMN